MATGAEEFSVDLYRRSALPLMDLHMCGLYTNDRLLVMAEAVLGPRSNKGEGDPNQDPDPPA